LPETSSDSGESTADAGCTKACTPPNSDLVQVGCNGGAGTTSGGSMSSPSPIAGAGTDSGTAPPSGTPGMAGSTSHNGGCQIGPGDMATDWAVGAVGVFAWVLRRGARRRRA
jgi:hypothetical protein